MQDSWRTQCLGPMGFLGSRCLCHPRHPHPGWAFVLGPLRAVMVRAGVPGVPGWTCMYCSHLACLGAAPGLWGRVEIQGALPSSHCLSPPSPGTFSVLDDEGPSEESHGAEGLHQTSGPPVLVQKEAYGARDGVRGAADGLCSFGMLSHTCGWPSKQGRVRTLMTRPNPDSGAHGPQVA